MTLLHSWVWRVNIGGELSEWCLTCDTPKTAGLSRSVFCLPRLRRFLSRTWWGD